MTQLTIPTEPVAPLRSTPQAANLPEICPVRDRCHAIGNGYKCGFEQAGTVAGCRKARGFDEERGSCEIH